MQHAGGRRRLFANNQMNCILMASICFSRSCPAPSQPDVCDPIPSSYLSLCGLINSSSNVFGNCILNIGLQEASFHTQNCITDACLTNGSSLCSSIKTFVGLCIFRGSRISCDVWQTATNYCKCIDLHVLSVLTRDLHGP